MEVVVQPTVEQAVELAARLIAARVVRAKPDLVLGLATGRTSRFSTGHVITRRGTVRGEVPQSCGTQASPCRAHRWWRFRLRALSGLWNLHVLQLLAKVVHLVL